MEHVRSVSTLFAAFISVQVSHPTESPSELSKRYHAYLAIRNIFFQPSKPSVLLPYIEF